MKYKKQVHLGYTSDGKQIRKWFYGNTKAELKDAVDDYKAEMKKVAHPSDMSFAEYSQRWFDIYKANRSKQTRDMYQNALNKCEQLDPFPVAKITRSMCQQSISANWKHPSSAKVLADTLRQIFKSAMADGIIAGNPADGLSLPKRPQRRWHLLTDKELEAVAKADLSEQDRLFVTILQVFGLRPSEALALQPSDFDWNRKVLIVNKAVELSNDNQSRIKETKTGVTREIPIPASIIPALRKRIRLNSGFLLFEKATGGIYTKSAYRRLSERILSAINVAMKGNEHLNVIPDVSLYSFRHRRATDLFYLTQTPGSGLSTKKAAYLMGHSELVFLTTYSHIMESRETADIYSNATIPKANNL